MLTILHPQIVLRINKWSAHNFEISSTLRRMKMQIFELEILALLFSKDFAKESILHNEY